MASDTLSTAGPAQVRGLLQSVSPNKILWKWTSFFGSLSNLWRTRTWSNTRWSCLSQKLSRSVTCKIVNFWCRRWLQLCSGSECPWNFRSCSSHCLHEIYSKWRALWRSGITGGWAAPNWGHFKTHLVQPYQWNDRVLQIRSDPWGSEVTASVHCDSAADGYGRQCMP